MLKTIRYNRNVSNRSCRRRLAKGFHFNGVKSSDTDHVLVFDRVSTGRAQASQAEVQFYLRQFEAGAWGWTRRARTAYEP